jgi:HD-GYP domain-containing protein (c-di-GMP phosphodiesterase class II)
VSSAVFGVILGMALSLCVSYFGCRVWEKRTGSEDLLFSELMIWGYLHRWHTQRRLASALDMLGPMSQTQRRALDGLSTKDQAKLLERLVARMETRDPYLNGHSRRVARHSWMIARRMGLPRAEVARIRTAAAIHDVGKIETPKAILHKAGPLSVEEYEVIKRHPGDGALMAAVLRDPELTSMVRHHHERLDGTGYPDGLSGEKIPLGARIIAVADTFDAITSARPYRPASPHKKAIDILRNGAGTRLDPAVVRAFCGHYAGRRPLALWALVAGLPERVVAWLGSSVATVASAAKVVAVAALVGGAAVTTSTLGLPVAKHHPTKAHSASMAGLRAQAVHSVTKSASVSTSSAGTPRSRRAERVRPAVVNPSVHNGSPAQQPGTNPSAGGTVGAQPSRSANPGTGSGSGTEPGKGEPPVKSEPPAKGKGEPPVKSEPPAKGEVPGKGNGEPPVKSEPPAKGKGAGKP